MDGLAHAGYCRINHGGYLKFHYLVGSEKVVIFVDLYNLEISNYLISMVGCLYF